MPAEMGKVAKPVYVCACVRVHGWVNGRVFTSAYFFTFFNTKVKHILTDHSSKIVQT